MLHILLLVLKIIGIILAAILGILVLLVCIVLFVPVRYEASGRGDGKLDSLKAKVRVTWLLRLVRVDAYYKENKFRWRFRIAWIKRSGGKNIRQEEQVEHVISDKEEKDHEEDIREETVHKEITDEKVPEIENVEEREESMEKTEKIPEEESGTCEKSEKIKEECSEDQRETEKEDEGNPSRLRAWFQKIKCTFTQLYDKIKVLTEKKNKLAEFIGDEVHKNAFLKLKKEVFRLIRKLLPGKLEANVSYGFEDPCTTGQVLAGLSILYPFMGDHVHVVPDFEHKVLKGNIHIKGNIRICHLAALCWRLFWNKNIRMTYRHIKNFEL